MATKKARARKEQLADELVAHFGNHSKIFVVEVDNVGSNQLHEIRKALRGKAVVYCGKNTQMRRVIRKLEEEEGRTDLEKIRNICKTNIGFVFTNESLVDIRDLILENRKPAAARAGAIAPVPVVVPSGVTSLEPTQTSFLQALNIASKITKGSIEILNDVKLLQVGDKVDASQATLLAKLEIFPFSYGLEIKHVFEDGSLFDPSVLDITDEQIVSSFRQGLQNVAALCIETNQPSIVSVPFSFLLAYKNILALACEVESCNFKQVEDMKAYLKDPSSFSFAAAPAAGGGGGNAAPAAAAAKPESSEEDDGGAAVGGMFGDDDY